MKRGGIDAAEKFVTRAAFRLRGARVTALVGPSGSGKSFRARLAAERRGMDLIVDDGLIVFDGSIIAGHWAKKERTLMAATRRALFADEEAALEVRNALRRVSFKHALVLATSIRMARRISENLCLPSPSEVISIESIATREEIEKAFRRRGRARIHSSPVLEVRIRRGVLATVLGLLRRMSRPGPVSTRVRATRSNAGGAIVFSEPALIQMVYHCVAEFEPGIEVRRVTATELSGMVDLRVAVALPYGCTDASRLHNLRETIVHSIERYAGIMIREVSLLIDQVISAGAAGAHGSSRPRVSDRGVS